MKKITKILIITFIISTSFLYNAFAYNFDFVTVTDVVRHVRKSFKSLKSYSANFKIISKKGRKVIVHSGVLKYKADNKLYLQFHKPYGQKIISNGKTMWIYIPSMNVVAKQDLESNSSFFSSNTKKGLDRLFSKYHYRFDSKEQPAVQKDGKKYYTLFLKQKESKNGYRTLKLWISESYFIVKAIGKTSSGKTIEISFSNLKKNIDLPNGIFKFDIPARARVINNPMVSEE